MAATLPSCGFCFPGNNVAASRELRRRTQYGANLRINAQQKEKGRLVVLSSARVEQFVHTAALHVRVFHRACVAAFKERRTAIVVLVFVNPQNFLWDSDCGTEQSSPLCVVGATDVMFGAHGSTDTRLEA